MPSIQTMTGRHHPAGHFSFPLSTASSFLHPDKTSPPFCHPDRSLPPSSSRASAASREICPIIRFLHSLRSVEMTRKRMIPFYCYSGLKSAPLYSRQIFLNFYILFLFSTSFSLYMLHLRFRESTFSPARDPAGEKYREFHWKEC